MARILEDIVFIFGTYVCVCDSFPFPLKATGAVMHQSKLHSFTNSAACLQQACCRGFTFVFLNDLYHSISAVRITVADIIQSLLNTPSAELSPALLNQWE